MFGAEKLNTPLGFGISVYFVLDMNSLFIALRCVRRATHGPHFNNATNVSNRLEQISKTFAPFNERKLVYDFFIVIVGDL